nr:MAG TPA: Putative HNHc nuclease [Caudoviricetes sp.]
MEVVQGKIVDYNEKGQYFTVNVPYDNVDRMVLRQYKDVHVGLPDQRTISPLQRKKAYGLMKDISNYCGYAPDHIKKLMKLSFISERLEGLQKSLFSLSDCDVTTAREFITFLIDFIIDYDIPTSCNLLEYCEDYDRYVYMCMLKKKCVISGLPAELHHIDTIGMGNNRDDILQIGYEVLPLCRRYHTEYHSIGKEKFFEKYHLDHGYILDKKMATVWGLTKKNKGEE